MISLLLLASRVKQMSRKFCGDSDGDGDDDDDGDGDGDGGGDDDDDDDDDDDEWKEDDIGDDLKPNRRHDRIQATRLCRERRSSPVML